MYIKDTHSEAIDIVQHDMANDQAFHQGKTEE